MATSDQEQKSINVPQHKRMAMGEKLDGQNMKGGSPAPTKQSGGLSQAKKKMRTLSDLIGGIKARQAEIAASSLLVMQRTGSLTSDWSVTTRAYKRPLKFLTI